MMLISQMKHNKRMADNMLSWRGKIMDYKYKINNNNKRLRMQALLNASKAS